MVDYGFGKKEVGGDPFVRMRTPKDRKNQLG
jgi:hypothetical protein